MMAKRRFVNNLFLHCNIFLPVPASMECVQTCIHRPRTMGDGNERWDPAGPDRPYGRISMIKETARSNNPSKMKRES